jgi:hypothetical protein
MSKFSSLREDKEKASYLKQNLRHQPRQKNSNFVLNNGSRVAVMGGGPAGSFFSFFLLDMAERAGIQLQVVIYEPRDFSLAAPQGCNMCGGVISEHRCGQPAYRNASP